MGYTLVMTESIHPSLLQRKIIHFDMDAFYASVEMRDDPSLRGKPLVVGGSPKSRGVVCTASYEARKYGIRSAMSCAQAAKLCPDAIFVRPNFDKYVAVSKEIRAIFNKYSDLVEPLSLDEAYLDVTNNSLNLYAVKIAKMIQEEIFASLQLTGSAGVAPNKLLAKIASDLRKPFGLSVILPEQVLAFMRDLALRKIHGIGPATERRLSTHGLKTCSDVWPFSLAQLEGKLGNMAEWLYFRSRGIDDRTVHLSRERKSLGREETFAQDLVGKEQVKVELGALADEIAASLEKRNLSGRTITLKVKYADFTRITRSLTLPDPICSSDGIRDVVFRLLEDTEAGHRKIRLLGISMANF